jgi:hypothetical protein
MPRRKKVKPPAELPPEAAIEAPAPATTDPVVAVFDRIVALWAGGQPFADIVYTLQLPMTGSQLRKYISEREELREEILRHTQLRAQSIGEEIHLAAKTAIAVGDFGVGIKTLAMLAEQLDPETWGKKTPKIEIVGAGGGAVQLTADVKLTPSEAYEKMVRGK